MKLLQCLLAALVTIHAPLVSAEEVVTSASAQIINGDVGQAREVAIRRAVARAAESKSAIINSETVIAKNSISDSTQIRSTACTGAIRVLVQDIKKEEITVTVSVEVLPDGCDMACTKRHKNTVVVTDFAIEFPEQLSREEGAALRYKSSPEITKLINLKRSISAFSASTDFPFESAAKAPLAYSDNTYADHIFSRISESHKSQYVLSGVYRDIGIRIGTGIGGRSTGQVQRTIQIDAYIHEGHSGKLIATKNFGVSSPRGDKVPIDLAVGSPEFYRTAFGALWKKSLDSVAGWAVTQSECLPAIARIVKIYTNQIFVRGALGLGMNEGDIVTAVVSTSGFNSNIKPGAASPEMKTTLNLVVRTIGPESTILESVDRTDYRNKFKIGDFIFIQ